MFQGTYAKTTRHKIFIAYILAQWLAYRATDSFISNSDLIIMVNIEDWFKNKYTINMPSGIT